jgi:hypothetical protein
MQLGQFPGVISAIDGTHIAIVAPPKNDLEYLEGAYVNRKNFHSLNVEVVSKTSLNVSKHKVLVSWCKLVTYLWSLLRQGCNAEMRITSINARFPGAANDSHIWATGSVRQFMVQEYEGGQRNTWLLGMFSFI